MREADGFPVGYIILAGIDIRDKRPRGSGRKTVITEDGRRLPHSLLPIEKAILGRASILGEDSGTLREVTPNMLVDELGSGNDPKTDRLGYETIKKALKRLESWGYMSSRIINRQGTRSPHRAYSITPEGLTRIED